MEGKGAVAAEKMLSRRWAYNQRARFLRVTGYNDKEGRVITLGDLKPMKDDFSSFAEYWYAMRRLHPGLKLR